MLEILTPDKPLPVSIAVDTTETVGDITVGKCGVINISGKSIKYSLSTSGSVVITGSAIFK